MTDYYNRALCLLIGLTALLTLGLIGMGTFISSGGYETAIPTWPLADGRLIPPQLVGGILYDFTHRSLAALVGLFTLLLGTYIWSRDPRPEVGRLAVAAIVLILGQIVLGGTGVLLQFPLWIESLHAFLAFVFFALLICLLTVYSAHWQEASGSPVHYPEKMLRRTRGLASMLLVQLALGAVARHATIFPIFITAILLHLVLALGVTIAAITTSVALLKSERPSPMTLVTWLLLLTVVAQFILGLAVFVLAPHYSDEGGPQPPSYIHSSILHSILAAVLLGATAYLTMMVRRKNYLAGPVSGQR